MLYEVITKFATVGFCWGGARSFHYATTQPDLNAAVVYYGTSPDLAALATVRAPVLGLYGGDDARVTATVAPAEEKMKDLGKTFVITSYSIHYTKLYEWKRGSVSRGLSGSSTPRSQT